ncbi:MAG: class I SAM-dependent methyltransferase [Dehalococcoidales bacterium]|nr:MAG: class I SAM-dependent methyltransferase [Dehalococcoidales bacterium]
MHSSSSVLDIGTGGGEVLLEMKTDWPEKVSAMEGYPPNVKLAREQLEPYGVKVYDVGGSTEILMPFEDEEFELILNRHSGFHPGEVARVLAPSGTFLTQQVHGLSSLDLMTFFDSEPPYPFATPEFYIPQLETAGLTIRDQREWSGKMTFTDVGSLVYYLTAIPWTVQGFSVETHSEYLIRLQQQVESGTELSFNARRYLIEANKKPM